MVLKNIWGKIFKSRDTPYILKKNSRKILGKSKYLFYMKKIIRLTESDISRIVKQVISESTISDAYFRRRGINITEMLIGILSDMKICKYLKLKTYFNHVMERLVLRLYVHNEQIKSEFESDGDSLESSIREYLIEEKLDSIIYFYKLTCGREPKY